ncbi:hypothetical protein AG1IA_03553 [Rhizoctonia solani AG-1 IA]|uniref:Uncharacterized protein n=1 Tax=Thanatephorus cucumeris (strain AG1-IA) TaxID=983506 RepID=L8X014_THACA|nr:hypothetical protein AG1IA_03553 [Rhizoctonia solani AG-1 IA]
MRCRSNIHSLSNKPKHKRKHHMLHDTLRKDTNATPISAVGLPGLVVRLPGLVVRLPGLVARLLGLFLVGSSPCTRSSSSLNISPPSVEPSSQCGWRKEGVRDRDLGSWKLSYIAVCAFLVNGYKGARNWVTGLLLLVCWRRIAPASIGIILSLMASRTCPLGYRPGSYLLYSDILLYRLRANIGGNWLNNIRRGVVHPYVRIARLAWAVVLCAYGIHAQKAASYQTFNPKPQMYRTPVTRALGAPITQYPRSTR